MFEITFVSFESFFEMFLNFYFIFRDIYVIFFYFFDFISHSLYFCSHFFGFTLCFCISNCPNVFLQFFIVSKQQFLFPDYFLLQLFELFYSLF